MERSADREAYYCLLTREARGYGLGQEEGGYTIASVEGKQKGRDGTLAFEVQRNQNIHLRPEARESKKSYLLLLVII